MRWSQWLPRFLSLRGAPSAEEEERQLERLEHRVGVVSRRLEVRRRRRERVLTAFRVYAFAGATVLAAYVYLFPQRLWWRVSEAGASEVGKTVVVVVALGGAVYLALYKVAALWYDWGIERAVEALNALRQEKTERIEQLKKRTRYYETLYLIEKYGGPADAAAASGKLRGKDAGERAPATAKEAPLPNEGDETAEPAFAEAAPGSPSPMARLSNRVVELLAGDDEQTAALSEREQQALQHLRLVWQQLQVERSEKEALRIQVQQLASQMQLLLEERGSRAHAGVERDDADSSPLQTIRQLRRSSGGSAKRSDLQPSIEASASASGGAEARAPETAPVTAAGDSAASTSRRPRRRRSLSPST
ncbi:hypothetical protein CDCA_CDCA06G1753 [Cyanidium caldarium]|uniref:Endoplasmic reticulum transmembrane protein n=1 Tax=Cyanidium caldarium TaxID=2771 RepID=A0AAV9IV71_CYACA|nr:hypothetical protein CDCA_CDCA06G1753 [Cyanidium caldarium]